MNKVVFFASGRRPRVLAAPFAGNTLQIWIRRMPMLHEKYEPRIVLHPRVASLQPVIEPAHGLIAPLDPRSKIRIVRKRMIPWPNDRFDWRFRLHQHVGHVVAIAVLQPSDQKTRDRDFTERTDAVAPERPIMLVLEIEQRPRRCVEARPEYLFIEKRNRERRPIPPPCPCSIQIRRRAPCRQRSERHREIIHRSHGSRRSL